MFYILQTIKMICTSVQNLFYWFISLLFAQFINAAC